MPTATSMFSAAIPAASLEELLQKGLRIRSPLLGPSAPIPIPSHPTKTLASDPIPIPHHAKKVHQDAEGFLVPDFLLGERAVVAQAIPIGLCPSQKNSPEHISCRSAPGPKETYRPFVSFLPKDEELPGPRSWSTNSARVANLRTLSPLPLGADLSVGSDGSGDFHVPSPPSVSLVFSFDDDASAHTKRRVSPSQLFSMDGQTSAMADKETPTGPKAVVTMPPLDSPLGVGVGVIGGGRDERVSCLNNFSKFDFSSMRDPHPPPMKSVVVLRSHPTSPIPSGAFKKDYYESDLSAVFKHDYFYQEGQERGRSSIFGKSTTQPWGIPIKSPIASPKDISPTFARSLRRATVKKEWIDDSDDDDMLQMSTSAPVRGPRMLNYRPRPLPRLERQSPEAAKANDQDDTAVKRESGHSSHSDPPKSTLKVPKVKIISPSAVGAAMGGIQVQLATIAPNADSPPTMATVVHNEPRDAKHKSKAAAHGPGPGSTSSTSPRSRSASAPGSGSPEEAMITCGIYTKAERRRKIERWREKRDRRIYTKKILYKCRKKFADNRPRLGGRFVSREVFDEHMSFKSKGPARSTRSKSKSFSFGMTDTQPADEQQNNSSFSDSDS